MKTYIRVWITIAIIVDMVLVACLTVDGGSNIRKKPILKLTNLRFGSQMRRNWAVIWR